MSLTAVELLVCDLAACVQMALGIVLGLVGFTGPAGALGDNADSLHIVMAISGIIFTLGGWLWSMTCQSALKYRRFIASAAAEPAEEDE